MHAIPKPSEMARTAYPKAGERHWRDVHEEGVIAERVRAIACLTDLIREAEDALPKIDPTNIPARAIATARAVVLQELLDDLRASIP